MNDIQTECRIQSIATALIGIRHANSNNALDVMTQAKLLLFLDGMADAFAEWEDAVCIPDEPPEF